MNELQRQRASIQAVRQRMAMAAEAYLERNESCPSPESLRRRHQAIRRINRLTEAWVWWREKRKLADGTIRMLDRASISSIMRATAKVTGVSEDDLKGRRRAAPFVQARQIGMYVSCHLPSAQPVEGRAFPESIGPHLGSLRTQKIGTQVESDPAIAALVDRVQSLILSKRMTQ